MSNERRDQRDGVERRTFPVTEARVQRDEDGNPEEIATDVAVFDRLSEDLGGFVERIEPGALEFAEDVTSEFNHNPDWVLGRTSAGTLRIEETDEAVTFIATPPNTSYARDLAENIDVGNVQGGSFTFRVPEGGDDFIPRDGEPDLRIITRATVFEGGPVTHPAYPDTHTELRDTSEAERRYRQWRESREASEGEPVETLTVRLDVDTSELREQFEELGDWRRKLLAMMSEDRQSDQDLRDRIRSALREAFGGEDTFVWIEDTFIEENEVVYRREDDDDAALFRVGFEVAEDGTVALVGEPVEVVRVTTYEEVGGSEEDEPEENSADIGDRLRLARLEVAEMEAEMAGSSG